MIDAKSNVNELSLNERLDRLRASCGGRERLIAELAAFLRMAPEERIVRINPIRYAAEHRRREAEIVDLFLHARKAGLLAMEWHYVCPRCGKIVDSFQTLNAAGQHYFCNTCLVDRETDLSDFVQVTFTVPKLVRASRYHDPETLTATERALFDTSENATVREGSWARDFYQRHSLFVDYVAPGETKSFDLDLWAGFVWLSHGPELWIDAASENRVDRIAFTHSEGRPAEEMIEVAPGPLSYVLTNASPKRIVAQAISLSTEELSAVRGTTPGMTLKGFLSGSRLLSTQTFLELFPSETVLSEGGLAIKRVALLFTDIKGSTALYERIGDMRAFDLVRQHFGLLRDVVRAHEGTFVKTIGDAVMASFHQPLNAIRAGLEILAQIRRFNEDAGEELITLKVGGHVGPCLAVTLNERLDFFGQTVNLAARVQGLAGASELYLTDELCNAPGGAELLASMQCETETVRVEGIDREICVRAVRSRS